MTVERSTRSDARRRLGLLCKIGANMILAILLRYSIEITRRIVRARIVLASMIKINKVVFRA